MTQHSRQHQIQTDYPPNHPTHQSTSALNQTQNHSILARARKSLTVRFCGPARYFTPVPVAGWPVIYDIPAYLSSHYDRVRLIVTDDSIRFTSSSPFCTRHRPKKNKRRLHHACVFDRLLHFYQTKSCSSVVLSNTYLIGSSLVLDDLRSMCMRVTDGTRGVMICRQHNRKNKRTNGESTDLTSRKRQSGPSGWSDHSENRFCQSSIDWYTRPTVSDVAPRSEGWYVHGCGLSPRSRSPAPLHTLVLQTDRIELTGSIGMCRVWCSGSIRRVNGGG